MKKLELFCFLVVGCSADYKAFHEALRRPTTGAREAKLGCRHVKKLLLLILRIITTMLYTGIT